MTKMTFLTLNEQKRERHSLKKRRSRLLALSLGMAGVLAALLLAQLLAHSPRCPGACQKQLPSFQIGAAFKPLQSTCSDTESSRRCEG